MTQRGALDAPLRFGANYTPSKDWMHSWLDFTPDDVRRDFAALAELGLDHVRVFPLWTVLQPNRTLIRTKAIDDVRAMVDIAAEFGLDASVDDWPRTWYARRGFTETGRSWFAFDATRRLP
jgi:hypothetical protein